MLRYNNDETENTNYWLASYKNLCREDNVAYAVASIYYGQSLADALFYTWNANGSGSRGVRPVVILDSNIMLSGSSSEGWKIN